MEGDDIAGDMGSTPPPDPKEDTSSTASVSSERRRSSRKSSLKPNSSPSTIPEASQQQEEEGTDAPPTEAAYPNISSSRHPSLSSYRDISSSRKSSLSSSSPPPTYPDISSSSRKPSLSSSSSPLAYPDVSSSSRKASLSSSSPPDNPAVSSLRKSSLQASLWPQPDDPNPTDISSADPELQSYRKSSLWPQPDPNPADVSSSSADPKIQLSRKSSLWPQPDPNPADASFSADPNLQPSRNSSLWPQPDPNQADVSSSADPEVQSSRRSSLWPQPDPNRADVSYSADPNLLASRKSSLWPQSASNPADISSSANPNLKPSRRSSLWPQSDPNPADVSSSTDPKLQSSRRSSLRPQPDANPTDVSYSADPSSTDPKFQSSRRSSLWPQPNANPASVSSSGDPTPAPAPAPGDDESTVVGETIHPAMRARKSMASRLFSFVASSPFPNPFISSRKSSAPAADFQFEGTSATLVVPVTEEQGMAEFLQKRTAAAAQHRHKRSGDPSSPASQVLLERRKQVFSTVQKARDRLSSLSIQTVRRKRDISKGCWGRFQAWVFEREQRRIRGKGSLNHLKLWSESLKKMEGGYGSSMMLAFAFIRWVLLLNLILAIAWLALMILPFLVHPPLSFHWRSLKATFGTARGIRNVLQGKALERTFVFYGGYTYTHREQKSLWRVDYMYPLLIGATFLLSFLGILGRIARRIMNAGAISMAAHYFPFSSLIFASWDFHVTSLEAAAKLRRGVRMQLKELYADALLKRKRSGPIHQFMSARRFLALCILWPLTMVGVVFAVDGLSKNTNVINSYFGSDYAQAILFGLLNNASPAVVRQLVEMENFKPATAERVVLSKLFFLRFLNLATFYSSSIRVLVKTRALRAIQGHEGDCFDKYCTEGLHCCDKGYPEWNICDNVDIQMHLCVPTCAENYVGGQILRLIVISSISRAMFKLLYGYCYICFYHGNKRQLLIEDMAMDVVYIQALVWWGVCFSPMTPIIGFFSNLFTFYTMRLALFKTCAPVEKAFSASRTSTVTYGVLLFTLILSTIPVSILVMEKKDGFCGPIYTQSSMYDIISGYVQKAPSSLWMAFTWILNPAVLLGVIFFLIFIVVLVQSQLIETRQFLALTKFEMGSQRKESTEKLKRMRQGVQTSLYNSTTGSLDSFQLTAALDELNWFRKPTLSPANQVPLDLTSICTMPSKHDHTPEDGNILNSSHANDKNDHQSNASSTDGSLKDLGPMSAEMESKQTRTKSQQTPMKDPSHGTDQMLLDNQNVEAQDWHSLGKFLRRLSQTQQNEIEVTKHFHQHKQESSLEDWYSLGQVLRRLSQPSLGMDNISTKENQEVEKVEEALVTTDGSNKLDSSKSRWESRAPIFANKIPLHDKHTIRKSAQFSSLVEDPLEKNTSIGSSQSIIRSQSVEFSTRFPEVLEASSSQMPPSSHFAQMISQSLGAFSGVSNITPTLQPFSDHNVLTNTSIGGASTQISPPSNPLIQDSTSLSNIEQETRLSPTSHTIEFPRMPPHEEPDVKPLFEPLPQQKLSIIDSFFPQAKVLRDSIKNRLRKRVIKTSQISKASPRRGRQQKIMPKKK